MTWENDEKWFADHAAALDAWASEVEEKRMAADTTLIQTHIDARAELAVKKRKQEILGDSSSRKLQLIGNSSDKKLQKIISGGQTGADRAALEAAREVGFETGGYAPRGFLTVTGRDVTLKSVFGLEELPEHTGNSWSVAQMYVQRSMKNVDASNCTVAFRVKTSTGTDKTIGYCATQKWQLVARQTLLKTNDWYRPCLIIDTVEDKTVAADKIVAFVMKQGPKILNVCGHREEDTPGFGVVVRLILVQAFKDIICRQLL